jgi:hypothetical protein
MAPVSFSDDEMAAVLAAAQPLLRERRDGFLRAVATDPARVPERGPACFTG